jgi:serine O-acetyltransferase
MVQYWPCWKSIQADTVRLHGKYSLPRFLRSILWNRNFRVIVTMRFCQRLSISRGPAHAFLLLARILHSLVAWSAGLELGWEALAGAGFCIWHGWGLVISPRAKIGCNVTVFHGVTIGQRDRIGPNNERHVSYPTIEDEVWLGPHAIVVGGVTIGRGARVAGGTLVTKDVRPFSIVGGNPMRVLRENAKPDVLNPASIHFFAD